MTPSHPGVPLSDFKILVLCACTAAIIETLVLGAVGFDAHWLAHPQKTKGLDPSAFIEAQVVQLPLEAKLTSEGSIEKAAKRDTVISKVAAAGKKATDEEKKAIENPEENVTKPTSESGVQLGATHGPVAVFTPSPVLPSYLTSQDLNKTVIIEFFITAQGAVIPQLIASSDNEELDALAVATAKKWLFRPAEQDHKAVDSKVRLRIVFEVH